MTASAKHVIVIGAGIAGCATAHAFAMRGDHVTLIERHPSIAQEASGNPVGVLYPRLASHATAQVHLSLASFLYTLTLIKTLKLSEDVFKPCGVLQLAFNARERKRLTEVTQRGIHPEILRWVTATEASNIAGIEITHEGVFLPQAGWVKPQGFCEALLKHPNIQLRTNSNALQLEKNQGSWCVKSAHGQLAQGDCVVIANANDARCFTQTQHLPLTPVRGQVSTTQSNLLSQALKTVVCTEGYLTPAVNQQHCFGASFMAKVTDLTVSETENLSNLEMLKALSPTLQQTFSAQVLTGRVALRCSTSDYLPLAGELLDARLVTAQPPRPSASVDNLPWLAGLYINVGHGSKGLTTAPYCAALLAGAVHQSLSEEQHATLCTLNPNRFHLRQLGLKRLASMRGFR